MGDTEEEKTEQTMICIDSKKELSLYDLEGKWNDYIGVQKEVIAVLKKENYFEENNVVNVNTGLTVRINVKGIKETIGTGTRFQRLPRKFKEYKIATIRRLKQIIMTADLLEDDVPNYHINGIYSFAYLKNEILIDDEIVEIRISIMKRIDSNWFLIHHIDEKERVLNYSTHP